MERPETEPTAIRIRLGGTVSVCAPVAASSAVIARAVVAELLHLGKERRRDGGHVGGLRTGDAGDEIHRNDQHVVQPAANVAEEVGEERDHPFAPSP